VTDIPFEAPPRSGNSIEGFADAIRKALGLYEIPFFPVVEFLEFGLPRVVPGMYYDVQSKLLLGGREGAVDPIKRAVYIREDVYDAAVRHERRARFTVAHEIGHALLHVGTLNRVLPRQSIPTFRQPEWQANRFAAALLMPRHLVAQYESLPEISVTFGVSEHAASVRARELKLRMR
jgi:IrrE N-terminal-like domain